MQGKLRMHQNPRCVAQTRIGTAGSALAMSNGYTEWAGALRPVHPKETQTPSKTAFAHARPNKHDRNWRHSSA